MMSIHRLSTPVDNACGLFESLYSCYPQGYPQVIHRKPASFEVIHKVIHRIMVGFEVIHRVIHRLRVPRGTSTVIHRLIHRLIHNFIPRCG